MRWCADERNVSTLCKIVLAMCCCTECEHYFGRLSLFSLTKVIFSPQFFPLGLSFTLPFNLSYTRANVFHSTVNGVPFETCTRDLYTRTRYAKQNTISNTLQFPRFFLHLAAVEWKSIKKQQKKMPVASKCSVGGSIFGFFWSWLAVSCVCSLHIFSSDAIFFVFVAYDFLHVLFILSLAWILVFRCLYFV